MKNKILSSITIIALSVCSLYAKSTEKKDEAAFLRQEIQKQELVLQAQKEKLAVLEARNVFEVLITSEGVKARGEPISITELEKELTELSDDAKILIRAEPSVPHKDVVSVLDSCRKVGCRKISLATTKAEPDSNTSTVSAETKDDEIKTLRNEIARQIMVLDALGPKLKQVEEAATYTIELREDAFVVEGKTVSKDKLISNLQALSPHSAVAIKASDNLPYKRVIEAMAFAKENSEITKVYLVTAKPEQSTVADAASGAAE